MIIFFLNILGPYLTLKRVKQSTSNLVHKLTMASVNQQMIKYPQMECGEGYVTIFLTFGTTTSTISLQRMVNYPHQHDVTLLIFWDCSLNLFRLKLKSSSFVICTQVDNTIQQLIKLSQKRRVQGF